MNPFEIIRAIILTLPLGIFVTIGLFTVVTISMKVRHLDTILRRILLFYCLSAVVASLLLLFYCYAPEVFARFDVLYCAAVVFAMVSFYHFMCFAIHKKLSLLHYIVPALVCGAMQFVKLLLPEVWEAEGIRFSLIVALLLGIAYSLLPLYTMNSYYMQLYKNQLVIDTKTSLRFIVEVLLFPVVFAIIPLVSGPEPGILSSVLLMAGILMALVMNIPLVYKIIRHYTSPLPNTPLFAPDFTAEAVKEPIPLPDESEPEPPTDTGKRLNKKYTQKNYIGEQLIEIDRREFEEFIRSRKPYLKHNLTIVEMAELLDTNRTYLSRFVNRVYGMTFSSYLNLCRLGEMERLLKLSGNREKTIAELAAEAGFVTVRNYTRAKKQLAAAKGSNRGRKKGVNSTDKKVKRQP